MSKSSISGANANAGGPSKNVCDEVPLLSGEHIVVVYKDITYLSAYSSQGAMKGTLTVTNYRLYFRSNANKDYPLILDVPLGVVSRVEKVGGQRSTGN